MTEDEAKGLRAGDRVLVLATFDDHSGLERPEQGAWCTVVGGIIDRENRKCWTPLSSIHSVLPRPLEVGDRLKHTTDRTSSIRILWLDARGALAEWDDQSRVHYDMRELLDPALWERLQ